MNLIQQHDVAFLTFFIYDANRNPVWYSSDIHDQGNLTWTGALYATNGPYFGGPFAANTVSRRQAGTARFALTGLDQGTLTWFIIGALGGAIVGQFSSLTVTFFASMAIGVIESVLTPFSNNFQFMSDFRKMTPFIVAVAAIMWISRRRTVVLAGREMR